jgi:DNA processing protein
MAAAAAEAGQVVVSGLALGIDAAAHEGAVDAGGRTLAVLASAVDYPTPRANASLADEILDSGGWLISERPPGARVEPWSFPVRNRIVAALCGAVLVVEAGLQSGTLSTVREALRLGALVGAVPGSVLSPASAGANALIRNGAMPVTCVADAVGLLQMRTQPPASPLRTQEAALLRGIPGAGAPAERWIACSGLPEAEARAVLLALIARGYLVRQGGRLIRTAS